MTWAEPATHLNIASSLPHELSEPVPVWDAVPPSKRHYFDGRRHNFQHRGYDFGSSRALLPLVRAFLATCAADRDHDYQYLFVLLGTELATNALRHSRSGAPEGHYALVCRRRNHGLQLTCVDQGGEGTSPLHVVSGALSAESESGKGLALVEAAATDWGNSLVPDGHRRVWFRLDFDLRGSRWNE